MPDATVRELMTSPQRPSEQIAVETTSTVFETFDLLTMAEAAELLHCSKAHVCKAVCGRVPGCPPIPTIPTISLGRRKLIRREALRLWIERNERLFAGATIRTLPVRDAGKRA